MKMLNVFGSSITVSFHTPSTFPLTYFWSVYGLDTVFLSTSVLLVPFAASISSSDMSSFFEQETKLSEQQRIATQAMTAERTNVRLRIRCELFIIPPTTVYSIT